MRETPLPQTLSLDELAESLHAVGVRLLAADPDAFAEMSILIKERASMLSRLPEALKSQPATAARAQLLAAVYDQARQIEHKLNAVRSAIREQLQSLYRDDFQLRAWAAAALNEPQECDCRG
jgi:hypothetical protein